MVVHKKTFKKAKRFVSKIGRKIGSVNPFRKLSEATSGKKKTKTRRPSAVRAKTPAGKTRPPAPPHNQATPRQVRPRVRTRGTPTQRRSRRVLRRLS